VDDDFINDVRTQTRQAAEALRAGAFTARSEANKCRACDYCGVCTSGRAIKGGL
jgi:predicted RecB family nuclease